PGHALLEVRLLIEGGERLLEPELHRLPCDQQLEAEVLGRIEGERAAVAVGRRERVGGVEAAQAGELEAVLLEEVAPLHALALAAGGVALEAGEAVQRRFGRLFLILVAGFPLALVVRLRARRPAGG